MTSIVHLVRHGEVYNPEKILYGRLPGYHLSDRGHAMARATAQSFEDHPVTHLVASPLLRAQQTAEPFKTVTGLELHTDPRLVEAQNDFQGLHIKGWDSALWNPKYWPKLINPAAPSWGEHFDQISERMWDAIDRARLSINDGEEAVLVSHQLPIVVVQRKVQGKPFVHNPAFRQSDLASVTSLVFDGDQCVDMIYTEPAQSI